MKAIERIIAEGSGKGNYIASGCFGRVYQHGSNMVYKEAIIDGTACWLERCFAIQKRLGADHPLCEFMPVIFDFKINWCAKRYTVVMERYVRVYDGFVYPPGHPVYSDVPIDIWANANRGETFKALVMRLKRQCESVIGVANDLHGGNILWCPKSKRWVVVDPSSDRYSNVSLNPIDPKFARAKRVVTQYGNPRRQ